MIEVEEDHAEARLVPKGIRDLGGEALDQVLAIERPREGVLRRRVVELTREGFFLAVQEREPEDDVRSDLNSIRRPELDAVGFGAVDEDSVGALQVFDEETALLRSNDARVDTADARVVDADVRFFGPTERRFVLVEGVHLAGVQPG